MSAIKIGLIGTGFARRVMLPAFRALEGVEITAVCSGRRENAERTAQEYGIPAAYDDYREMLEREPLDLVAIVTPPHLHRPMALAALERGLHVLCEKPTALNAQEAREMLQAAERAGVLHLIDHELRFHPSLQKLRALIEEGELGAPERVTFSIHWRYPMDPKRPWGWWFDASKGGGLLGALGSHQIDLLRWLLGDLKRVCGHLHTVVKERPHPETGELVPVTSDDYCAFFVELQNGAVGAVVLDATARAPSVEESWRVVLHGERSSLLFDGLGRLWCIVKDGEAQEITPQAPVYRVPEAEAPGLPEGVFPTGFWFFAREIVAALREGRTRVEGAATFHDGLKVQEALDAVRASHAQRRWVELT